MEILFLTGVLLFTYAMVNVRRMTALIRNLRLQSLLLSAMTLFEAIQHQKADLYFIAVLLFILKAVSIPRFLFFVVHKLKINENLGLFINPQLSVFCAGVFTCLSWLFSRFLVPQAAWQEGAALTVSFTMLFIGMFIMIFRMKALTQIIGLLVMENGLFLLAATMIAGMPFLVELAIFLDVLVSVIILGLFMYRINTLFTHIDVNKLTGLKG